MNKKNFNLIKKKKSKTNKQEFNLPLRNNVCRWECNSPGLCVSLLSDCCTPLWNWWRVPKCGCEQILQVAAHGKCVQVASKIHVAVWCFYLK